MILYDGFILKINCFLALTQRRLLQKSFITVETLYNFFKNIFMLFCQLTSFSQILLFRFYKTSIMTNLINLLKVDNNNLIICINFLIFQNINMNQNQKNSLQYQISLNSFRDEVASKQMIIEKLTYQLNIKIGSQSFKKKQSMCEIIKFCRKDIEQIQKILVDIHSYFVDLKLQFVYDLYFGLFKNIIQAFKLLSEHFVRSIKDKKANSNAQFEAQTNFLKSTQKIASQFKGKNLGELQYFDSLIRAIQLDELRIAEKKRQAEQKLNYQKNSIDGINASDAVNQLETLKKHMDRIIMYSIKLGDEGCNYRSEYNYKQIKSLRKPEDIQQQYCNSIAQNTKRTFVSKMYEISLKNYKNIKEKEKNIIIQQIKAEKSPVFSKQTQTYEDCKNRSDFNKDKSTLVVQNDQLRKTNSVLKKQLNELSSQMEEMEKQYKQIQKKIQISTDMLTKKMMELQKAKVDFQYSLNKKDMTIQALNKKIVEIRSQCCAGEVPSIETPTNQQDRSHGDDVHSILSDDNQDLLSSKLKGPPTHRTSFFYQKQFKATKQQNNHLRRSLTIMLDALQQQKLILQYPISDLNNDLRLGKLIDKIEAISIQLLKKVKQIKLRDPSKQQLKLPTHKKYTKKIINIDSLQNKQNASSTINTRNFNEVQTQTLNFSQYKKQQISFSTATHKKSINNKSSINLINSIDKPLDSQRDSGDKLQNLKKQLINRVSAGKRKNPSIRRTKPFLHQTQIIKNNNITLQNLKSLDNERVTKKTQNSKVAFNRKDISFQQFKFEMCQNKSQDVEKKILYQPKQFNNLKSLQLKDRKRYNNKSYQNITHMRSQPIQKQNEPVFGVQGYQCMTEVRKVLQIIETKSQKKQAYFKYFLRMFVQELKRSKGLHYIDQIMQSNKQQSDKFSGSLV